jgi:hypothetical protein
VHLVFDVAPGEVRVGRFGWKSLVASLRSFSPERVPERDGHHDAARPGRELPAGDCGLLACDPVPGVDDDLEDVDSFAAVGPSSRHGLPARRARGHHRGRDPRARRSEGRGTPPLRRPLGGGTRALVELLRTL